LAALIDFDREYMRYAALRLKGMGELKDDALEKALNDTMKAWLNERADWLDGMTPDEYFAQMDGERLVEFMADYSDAGMNVPEPLYRRLAARPDSAGALKAVVCDDKMCEQARATALRLLCDMNADGVTDICVRLMATGSELTEMAAAWLLRAGYAAAEKLLAEYDGADDAAQEAMLDVLCYYPGVERTGELLRERLLSDHERRAQHAAMAARLGDPGLIEPLKRLANLSEISYYDYKEIINAIDALGGDHGEERQFYGDPDYELMRNPDISLPEDWRADNQ
jgi:HEAT repeat protein